ASAAVLAARGAHPPLLPLAAARARLRRAAGSASHGRTRVGGTCGSPRRRRTTAATRRPAAPPHPKQDPDAPTLTHTRAGGAVPRGARAPRAGRAGRTPAPA